MEAVAPYIDRRKEMIEATFKKVQARRSDIMCTYIVLTRDQSIQGAESEYPTYTMHWYKTDGQIKIEPNDEWQRLIKNLSDTAKTATP